MSQIDNEILKEFVSESKGLIESSMEILETTEGDFSRVTKLADYGNLVDRIMGGAKNLATLVDQTHSLHLLGNYAAVCKAVGYKASQITKNEELFNVCVALLLDATETLSFLLENLDKPRSDLKKSITDIFLERLKWISAQFKGNVSGTVSSTGAKADMLNQDEIDSLLKKLG